MSMMGDVGIILQARMGSSRLPGKVLYPFGNTSLLGWILCRLKLLDWPVIVATSDKLSDDIIERHSFHHQINCFRGDEDNVLDRYYQCAIQYKLKNIIRLTSDNPYPDIFELNNLLHFHINGNYDYSHNLKKLPVGVGCEVFTMNALENIWLNASSNAHREHVNEYIFENKFKFNVGIMEAPENKRVSNLSLTIDTKDDFDRIYGPSKAIKDYGVTTEELLKIYT